MNRLSGAMTTYGEDIINFLNSRLDKVKSFGLKGENEFETIWNAAEAEGRRRELQEIINYLNSIWK